MGHKFYLPAEYFGGFWRDDAKTSGFFKLQKIRTQNIQLEDFINLAT